MSKKMQVLIKILFFVSMMIAFYHFNTIEIFAQGKKSLGDAWTDFFKEYRVVMAYISGFGALTSILVFIHHFLQLGASGSNPAKRQEVLMNLLISSICTALLGGLTVLLTFYYTFFLGN